MEPQAILFDEPTSALDPRMTAEVLAVMTDLAGDGLTMIVVTHAMQFARRVAHTVHVFGDGRVIESGPPGQIFDDPHEEATRMLLSLQCTAALTKRQASIEMASTRTDVVSTSVSNNRAFRPAIARNVHARYCVIPRPRPAPASRSA